ncbi:glycine--tRNA ligase [Methanimicrococcus blatticola]|uniref:glycine--tRNA ligase n=1 Tax=Methanimicrococcus blatticola TaxID=91560 RepID=A0A484F4S9_9EURY|nr:glycine--tRNA ligase [Methanimicrococcus blatticola]MBZ3936148.1 glycine--tRNA ligase [Methanimicrococcus blatticola]MCC2508391.1 glycine--tRNA ligase [Methanimicrococcus blatticola]TDQ70156.1 glycyl-tRNA synthetase [Methanimicrococcus blatticola]
MDKYDKVMDLAKRRGFLWNSFELYGGAAGFFDYGPLGCTVKRKIENLWRDFYVLNEGCMEIEAPTIGIEDIFVASGHVGGFSDPLTECSGCGQSFRADHLIEALGIEGVGALNTTQLDEMIVEHNIVCPECGCKLGKSFEFNLMFQTKIGPGTGRPGYLRPETAQGMFVDFQRLSRFYREKLPFGAVQIGKSYRNEISPRQGVLRLREFTQAECEFFVDPDVKTHPNFDKYKDVKLTLYPQAQQEDETGTTIQKTVGEAVADGTIAHEFLAYYVALTNDFLTCAGISPEDLRFRQHLSDEMAHYAVDCWDAEIKTDRFGWVEAVGIADRTDYDLTAHAKQSKVELSVYIEYPEPIFETKFVVKPDMGKLGPLFKGQAKAVGDALKELSADAIQAAGDEITVSVNGENFTVPKNLIAFGEENVKISGKTIVPHVIEPSYGIDRITYCVMEHAYDEEDLAAGASEEDDEESRIVMRFKNIVAPYQVAVHPLMGKPELSAVAKKLFNDLVAAGIMSDYDESGTIGKRYRRNDEIGIPFSVTIDFDTIEKENKPVTIRDRDTMKQILVSAGDLVAVMKGLLSGEKRFEESGEVISR